MTGISEQPEIVRMAEGFAGNGPVNQLAIVLMKTWGEKDPNSNVAKHPASYVATFADMARAVVAWSEGRDVAAEIEAERLDTDHDAPGADAYINGLIRAERIARHGR